MGLPWFLASFFPLATASSFARHQEAEQRLDHSTLHLPLYHVQRHDSHKSEHLFGQNFITTPFNGVRPYKGSCYINIRLGTPPKSYTVIVDTGSSFSWVQCQPCIYCSERVPFFVPSASSTYKTLPCSTTECNSLKGGTGNAPDCTFLNVCKYSSTYVDNSSSRGNLSRDSLSLAESETLPGFVCGCAKDNDFHSESAGFVGMAPNNLSMISQLSAIYGHDFSYCFPTASGGSGGKLSMGRDSLMEPSYKFTPMLPNCPGKDSSLYYLRLSAIVIAGKTLVVAEARAEYCNTPTIIDSGTVVTRLPRSVFANLSDEFKRIMSEHNIIPIIVPHEFLKTCYKGSLKEISSYVPEVRMLFQGEVELTLPPQNVIVEADESTSCLAFADNSDNGGTTIIGNIQLQTYSVAYDVSNSRIGFAAGVCS